MTYLNYTAIALFMLGMLLETLGFVRLQFFYQACRNIQQAKHALLKQILLRFTNCSRLNIQICNTSAFVKRYIYNYSVVGLHYNTLEKFSVLCVILGLLCTTFGTFRYGETFYHSGLLYILLSIVYVLFGHLLDTEALTEQCVSVITDYLDNTLNHRILSAEKIKKSANPHPQSLNQSNTAQHNTKISDNKENGKQKINTENDEIIFSVINDFLI